MADARPSPSRDLPLLREAVARALEDANRFDSLANQAEDPTVRAYLVGVARTAKAHATQGWSLLGKHDADQSATAPLNGRRAPEVAPVTAARVVHEAEAPPSPTAGALTVGSLRKR